MDRPRASRERPAGDRRLGRYELVSPIGETELGDMFDGRISVGPDKGHRVIVRRIRKAAGHDDAMLHAIREAATEVGEVRHPSVTGILEVRLGTSLVIAAEYADGVPLRSIMNAARKRGTALPAAVVVRLIIELLRAMTDAREALDIAGLSRPLLGVCPDVALVGEGGTVVVADLGLMTLGRPPRTPELMAYRAPEQLGALASGDVRSELFSIGTIWWELLANRPLFGGGTQAAVWQRVRQGSIMPPSGSTSDVSAVVMTLLERNPEARLRDVDEVMGVIQEFGAEQIATAEATTQALRALVPLAEASRQPTRVRRPTPSTVPKVRQQASGGSLSISNRASEPRAAEAEPADQLSSSSRAAPRRSTADAERRPATVSEHAAVRPTSFAPAPLPEDLPGEDDWGDIEELSDLDLTSLRPSERAGDEESTSPVGRADTTASDGASRVVVELSDLDLTSLRPSEPPGAREPIRESKASKSENRGAPPGTAVHTDGWTPLSGQGSPDRDSQRPTTEIGPDTIDQVMRDGIGARGTARASGEMAAEPDTEDQGAADTDTDVGAEADRMADLPKFADDDERPVEETLREVLRDAARPPDAPAPPSESDAAVPVAEPEAQERSESPTVDVPAMTRSPLASEPDEMARVSGIEEIAAQLREEGPPLAMPIVDDEGPAGAAIVKRRGTAGRALFVATCFAASFVAAFAGLRAVLVGTLAQAPSSASVHSEPRAEPNAPAPDHAPFAAADGELEPVAASARSGALPEPSAPAASAPSSASAPLDPVGSRPVAAPGPIQPPPRPSAHPLGALDAPAKSTPAPAEDPAPAAADESAPGAAGAALPNDDPYD